MTSSFAFLPGIVPSESLLLFGQTPNALSCSSEKRVFVRHASPDARQPGLSFSTPKHLTRVILSRLLRTATHNNCIFQSVKSLASRAFCPSGPCSSTFFLYPLSEFSCVSATVHCRIEALPKRAPFDEIVTRRSFVYFVPGRPCTGNSTCRTRDRGNS